MRHYVDYKPIDDKIIPLYLARLSHRRIADKIGVTLGVVTARTRAMIQNKTIESRGIIGWPDVSYGVALRLQREAAALAKPVKFY